MQRKVIAIVDDMLFAAKIRGTAEALGTKIQFARSTTAVREAASDDVPLLIIIDLHVRCCDPFELAEQLKADENLRTIPLLGFFSHVQTELMDRAKLAGFDRVVPRSYFSSHLAEILKAHV